MLEGKNVRLRPIWKKDIKYFLQWFNDMAVARYLGSNHIMMESAEEKWIENLASATDRIVLMIEARTAKNKCKPIGTCGFHNIKQHDQRAEFGIAIGDKKSWGKGYGTEAAALMIEYGFNNRNFNCIASFAFTSNAGSIRLHEKLGFHVDGRQRAKAFINGQFCDDIAFSLLRSEWNGKLKAARAISQR